MFFSPRTIVIRQFLLARLASGYFFCNETRNGSSGILPIKPLSSKPPFDLPCAKFTSPGGGALPYMGYTGMCGHKGYVFLVAVLVSILAILAINRVWF